MNRRKVNLRSKLIFFLTFFLLVPIFIFGMIVRQSAVDSVVRYKDLEYSKMMHHAVANIEAWFRTTERIAQVISELPLARNNTQIDINRAMRQFIDRFPRFTRLRFLDLEGQTVVEEPLPVRPLPSAYSSGIARVIQEQKTFCSDGYPDSRLSVPVMTMFLPVFEDDGELGWILAADLNLTRLEEGFNPQLADALQHSGVRFVLADRQGTVISGFEHAAVFQASLKNPGTEITQSKSRLRIHEDKGNSWVTLSQRSQVTGWHLLLLETEETAFEQVVPLRTSIAFLIILCSVVTVLGGLFVVRRTTSAIDQLVGATQEIARQQYDIHLDINTNDELEDLAHSFLHMAREIRRKQVEIETFNRELETMVTLRTLELSQSRNTLSALLEAMNDDVLFLDHEGVIRYCNQHYIRRFGDRSGQSGESAIETRAGDFPDFLRTGQTGSGEQTFQAFLPDGSQIYLDVTTSSVAAENEDDPPGKLLVLRDVTQRVRRDREILELKDHYLRIFSSLREGVVLVDPSGRVREFNPSALSILGLPPTSLADRLIQDVFRELQPDPDPFLDSTLLSGDHLQCVIVSPAEGRRVILLSCRQIPRDYTLWVYADMTAFKDLEAQLIQADKLASLGQLMAGMAHEINNPLTGILGFSSMLKAQEKDSQKAETLGRIIHSAHRINHIIVNMRQFATPSRRVMTHTRIDECIRQTLDLLTNEVDKHRAQLEFIPGNLPESYLDPNQLQQVITNLVLNALHALQPEVRPGKVTIATRRDGNQALLTVADNGVGIPENLISRVFDPFFTTKADWKGTGLGLSICYTIVQNHQGTISVESKEGEATTITVRLPLVQEALKDGKVDLLPIREYSVVDFRERLPERILVVEDEEYIRLMFEAFPSHSVTCVETAAEALDEVTHEQYDLLIVDLRLPDMNGTELIGALRARGGPQKTLVITGCSQDDELVQRATALAGVRIVFKPFTIQDIIWRLEHWEEVT